MVTLCKLKFTEDDEDHNLTGMERHTSSPAPRDSETHGGSDVGIYSSGMQFNRQL